MCETRTPHPPLLSVEGVVIRRPLVPHSSAERALARTHSRETSALCPGPETRPQLNGQRISVLAPGRSTGGGPGRQGRFPYNQQRVGALGGYTFSDRIVRMPRHELRPVSRSAGAAASPWSRGGSPTGSTASRRGGRASSATAARPQRVPAAPVGARWLSTTAPRPWRTRATARSRRTADDTGSSAEPPAHQVLRAACSHAL